MIEKSNVQYFKRAKTKISSGEGINLWKLGTKLKDRITVSFFSSKYAKKRL